MKQRSWDVRKDAFDSALVGVAGRRGSGRGRTGTAGNPVKRPGFEQVALEVWPLFESAFSATGKA